ncbi:Gfo/Idh/MocA family protein [Bauldia litoralis]|uniref:Predicted dehydrogenase n=1 Tax=Bauldia litoralis TaxID=665467 RepID=A0A1G6D900_9HYPH|nr:Gfo/Idh/MocA family oxidoreductase [Bauldia litoralis]SDB41664.1 Predicted dehydrogenase [Bauldia litoralis]
MSDSVKVALVGCGFFARNHLFSWKDLAAEGADLVAVCDIDAAKAEAAAKEFNVPRWYTDFDAMVEAEQIDLLDIATRMDTHRMLVEKAIGRGIATIVQKPFAPTWEDAVAMTAAAEKAGVFLAVHENFRFQTPLIRVAETLRTGVIGTPSWGRISFRTGYDIYAGQPYFFDEERFIILDLGVHTLDIARVFMGEVERVYCETQQRNPKVKAEDTATVMLKHVSGAVSVVDFTYESRKEPDPFPETMVEIEGPDGAVVVDAGLTMQVTSGGEMRTEDIGAPLLHWTSKPWHVAQESVLITCRHMLESFRAKDAAATAAADNLKTFAVVEAAYESAASGTAVKPRAYP